VTIPTYDQLKKFRDVHVATWNSGDREGFLNNFRQFLAGAEYITMWDPVGTEPRCGLTSAAADPFDMWQPVTRFWLGRRWAPGVARPRRDVLHLRQRDLLGYGESP
jgi:hypothetical protein